MQINDERPMIEGHTSKAFDGELASLHMQVIRMGGLVLDQVRAAVEAYTEDKAESAQRVIERERIVNAYEAEIDVDQFKLIARRSPVASDLRAIVALSRCAAELERAGDEAKKIARPGLHHDLHAGAATARDARHLGGLAVSLLRLALESLDGIDPRLATEVIAKDKELDAEYAAGLRRLMTRAMENPRQFDVTLEAAFVLKSMERIGDHARNVARQVLSILRETQAPFPAAHSTTMS